MFLGRVVGEGEPLWLDEDRDYALALHFLEQETCGGCGQPRSESTAIENDGAYRAEPVRCHACAALSRQSTKFLDGAAASAAAGLTFYVHKR